MKLLLIFFYFQFLRFRHQCKLLFQESRLKQGFITTFVITYFIVGVFVSYKTFYFVMGIPLLGPMLIERVFYMYFFLLFFMLMISSFLITLSSLFSSKETFFLLLQPVKMRYIYFIKFLEVGFLASWAFLFLSIPFFIGFGLVKQIHLSSYILSFFCILTLFVILCCSSGFLLCLLSVRFLWKAKERIIIFLIILIPFIYNLKSHSKPSWRTTDVHQTLNQILIHTEWSIHPYIPSTWLTKLFFSISQMNPEPLYIYFSLTISMAFFLILLILFFADISGQTAWSAYQSGDTKVRKSSFSNWGFRCYASCSWIPRHAVAVFFKDLQLFFRDPVQYTQFGIFFGLLGVYIYNLKNMKYDITDPFWQNLITFLNLGSVCLTLATLSTRFIYPQVSLEGNNFWILDLSPVKKKTLLWTKFVYSSFFSLLITTGLVLLSNHILHLEKFTAILVLSIAAITASTLSAFSVGLGAIFPNFHHVSAAAVVSGFGGTLTLIISLVYVSISVFIPAYIGYLTVKGGISEKMCLYYQFIFVFLLLFISIILIAYIMKQGIETLERYEH